MGRIASSITTAFDVKSGRNTKTNFPDWGKAFPHRSPSRVTISEGVYGEVFDRVIDAIKRQGGEVFDVDYTTTRVNPYSVVVTMFVSSPDFGVRRLGCVAFDPHEVEIVVTDDGREEVRLAEE